MAGLSARPFDFTLSDESTLARKRMALFPADSTVLFPDSELWVPVVVANNNVFILPGVPRLFTALLAGLKPLIAACVPPGRRQHRVIIATELPESAIAPYLTKLQKKVQAEDIKVGSYPKWMGGVKVSLLGRDVNRLEELVAEVEQNVKGKRRSEQDEEFEEQARRAKEVERFKKDRIKAEQ
jgi:molybdopterin-biosynthesis enzyme MoeA-like protein